MKIITLHKEYTRVIAKAAKGNRRAQQQLFDLFAPKMLSVCRKYMRSNELAEEVMLAGFLKVFTHLKSFKNEGSFEGWIRRIMVNESLSQLRKEKKLHFYEAEILENSTMHATQIDNDLEVADIQKIIDDLPDGYRTVFVLYVVEGYNHREIAEVLQISEGTSKSQLSKARKMLQTLLVEQNKIQYGTH